MKNLEIIEKSFGVTFVRACPVFGRKFSLEEMLVRRLMYTGGLERVKYPFSLREHLEPRPKSCFDLALILALDGDHPRLVEVCEAGQRLEKIRLQKERDLKGFRDQRLRDLRQDGLEGDLVVAVVGRYDRAQKALSSALRKEVEVVVGRWTRWGDWVVQPSREAEVNEAWDMYFGAENALKESLVSKVISLGWKTRG